VALTHPRVVRALVAVLAIVAVGSGAVVAAEFAGHAADPPAGSVADAQAGLPYEDRRPVVPPANGTTVVTVQKFRRNFLVAFAPDGRVLHFENAQDRYYDVDPAPGGARTVEVVTADHRGETTVLSIRRINLTTGATEVQYRHAVPRVDRPHRWHDVDRVGPSSFLVADIDRDAVFVVNTTTGERTYEWSAQSAYDRSSGGPYPADWTHLNDVERLPDGRYMVSLRNQDSVVFLDPGSGLDRSWTLGADGDHAVLYEQHNPDYLPGGPSVLVADSQNDRIVEYRRTAGGWERTWTWSDGDLRWPRDADRLPNGHTLVGDTNGGRVLEVDETGRVVWAARGLPAYDVERLGTGDESAGGRPAEAVGVPSREAAGPSAAGRLSRAVVPTKVRNSVGFVAPVWLSATGRLAAVTGALSTAALAAVGAALWVARRLPR